MFCPQCGAENSLEQKYCRRCGLQLAAARISLQGSVGKALTRHRTGQAMLSGGGVTMVIFILAALANIVLNPGPWNYAVVINLLLGLVIAVPLMAAGLVHLRRAGRSLHPKDDQGQLAADQSDGARGLTSSAYSTDRLLSPVRAPASVAEPTTLHLKSPEQGRE
jgi:zinc-ribbon domain